MRFQNGERGVRMDGRAGRGTGTPDTFAHVRSKRQGET
jgi:hypothetical protein